MLLLLSVLIIVAIIVLLIVSMSTVSHIHRFPRSSNKMTQSSNKNQIEDNEQQKLVSAKRKGWARYNKRRGIYYDCKGRPVRY